MPPNPEIDCSEDGVDPVLLYISALYLEQLSICKYAVQKSASYDVIKQYTLGKNQVCSICSQSAI